MYNIFPIRTFYSFLGIIRPLWFLDSSKEVSEYMWWLSYIKREVQPLWEKEVKEKDKEFLIEIIKEDSDWVRKKKLEYLNSKLIFLNSLIIFWTNKLDNFPEWLGQYIYEDKLVKLFKKKRGTEFEIQGWRTPTKENNNKITKLDIERAKDVLIQNILNGEPLKKSRDKWFYSAPWRDDKDPSLCVYLKTNSWADFGEGNIGSDVIGLVMKIYKLEFLDAVRFLLNK